MIRNINIKDAKEIRELCYVSLGYEASLELVIKQIERLSKDSEHHFIFVYEDSKLEKVVGFVHAELYESLYADSGLNILGLAVHPEYQGQGIGKKLMAHLENIAVENSIKFIRLNSAVKRTDAHKFYENIDYISDKEQKRFIKIFK